MADNNELTKSSKTITDLINNFIKDVGDSIEDLYHKKHKTKLETSILFNEDDRAEMFLVKIPTKLKVQQINKADDEDLNFKVLIVSKNDNYVEDMILTAMWHGTGGNLNKQILDYLVNVLKLNLKSGSGAMKKEYIRPYYFNASNADMHFADEVEFIVQGLEKKLDNDINNMEF